MTITKLEDSENHRNAFEISGNVSSLCQCHVTGREAACPCLIYVQGCVRWLWVLGVYMCLCALTVSLLSREHDRADSGVLHQPAGLARVGGAPAEADEGHVCEQPHHQTPLGAITHSKAP